jgi:hypothetical protein
MNEPVGSVWHQAVKPAVIRYAPAMSNQFRDVFVKLRSGAGLMLCVAVAVCTSLAAAAAEPTMSAKDDSSQIASSQTVLAQLSVSPAAAEYKRKLAEYQQVRGAFEEEASAYWNSISEKRRTRNAKRRDHVEISPDDYVLVQPPIYNGPKRPTNPEPGPEVEKEIRPPKYIPVVADFLKAAVQYFQFVPQRPVTDVDFKRVYVKAATAEGLTKDQIIRVYTFETGGNGGYDMQSGFTPGRSGGHAISTAVGYNQLLTTNTVELLAEQGDQFIRALNEKAKTLSGPPRKAIEQKIMEQKIAVLKRMVAFCQSVPDDWNQHEKLANTEQGWGVHAMVLDIDVGPLLQTHKLLTSVVFARNKGTTRPLTAAELEMMNLTGDGTGLDMVTMPGLLREQVPTSNFFQRGGYDRNPVASRNNTVAKLFAVMNTRMDSAQTAQGARDFVGLF